MRGNVGPTPSSPKMPHFRSNYNLVSVLVILSYELFQSFGLRIVHSVVISTSLSKKIYFILFFFLPRAPSEQLQIWSHSSPNKNILWLETLREREKKEFLSFLPGSNSWKCDRISLSKPSGRAKPSHRVCQSLRDLSSVWRRPGWILRESDCNPNLYSARDTSLLTHPALVAHLPVYQLLSHTNVRAMKTARYASHSYHFLKC